LSDDDTGEIEATARQLMRRFDGDPAGAAADFGEILNRKAFAGKVQQLLNRLGRHDVAASFAAIVPLDPRTPELVITETARGLAQSGGRAAAQDLLQRAGAARRLDYGFNLSAGRVMAEIRAHALAASYFEAAFLVRPTQQAAERMFLAYLALQNYPQAADAMSRILRAGSYGETMAKDFAFLLSHVTPGRLDPDLAFALASLPNPEPAVGSALTPHLIAQDALDSVLTVLERDIQGLGVWDEAVLLELVAYLARHNRIDHLLSVNDQYDGGSIAVAQAIARVLDAMPAAQMTQFLSPNIGDFLKGPDAQAYRDVAARFSQGAGGEEALAMLKLVPSVVAREDAERFFAREKSRLSRLAAHAMEKLDRRADAFEALVAVALHFVDPRLAAFFAGAAHDELVAALVASRRLEDAPAGTRLGRLRDDYYAFHIERRTLKAPDALESDIEFAESAFDYFYAAGQARPAISIPAGGGLRERAGRTAMVLDGGRTLDVLTNWGLLQNKPLFSLVPPTQYDPFYDWYVNVFFGQRRLSPEVLNASLAAHLNEALAADPVTGLPATRYLRLAAKAYRKSYDLANLIDRNLFVLHLIATQLAQNTQLYPFFQGFLGARDSLLVRLIAALGGGSLIEAAHGVVPPRPAIRMEEGAQDILLIGHASKETGLGRNFGMLKRGLDGFNVTGLDFEAGADAYNAELRRWRAGLRTPPLAVIAINAHDVPDVFLKDRDGLLEDCHAAGFFLWEMTRIPRLQHLGVAMVDEVWAPTRYVADIYGQYKPTHVVGKGLFDGPLPVRAKTPNARFTFVTVFDFDSSIERKNPLAAVLAFQKAFAGSDAAELVVKTSNVNPQHWSNAQRQWEKLTRAAEDDSRIRIVTQRYTDEEMEALLCGADCIVSLHRSEGFGYLMSDAMAYGVPVIATDYSGNADFADETTAFPVAYRLIAVPQGAARWHLDGGEWADADIDAAARRMREVFEDRDTALVKAARARAGIQAAFGMETFRATLARRVQAIQALWRG